MKISYGPPGQRGVTTLMAVGDDAELASATKTGAWISLGVMATGWLLGSPRLADVGAGGAIALIALRVLTKPKPIPVTQPA
jgi:hypothetical protein